MKSVLFACTSLALFSGALHALPIRFLAWDDAVGARKLGVVSSKGVDPIVGLHPLKRSEMVNATPGEEGLVVRAIDRNTPDGKPIDFKVEKGAAFQSPLVILLADPKAPSGLRGFAVDDSNSNFPWGSFRLMNATGKPLGFVGGKERKVLPADWAPVNVDGNGGASVPVALYSPEKPAKPAYSTYWSCEPNTRHLVFILNNENGRLGPVAVKVVIEDREPVAASGR